MAGGGNRFTTKKKKSGKNVKGSKSYIRKTLLKQKTTKKGNEIYRIPPSKVRDEELKRLVKRANDRLYKMEKAGVTDKSREYRTVQHYAVGDPNGKGFIYNVNQEQGRIRFTSSTFIKDSDGRRRKMTTEERSYLVNTVRNFLNAETSTISGTKKAFSRAYMTFMQNNGQRSSMSEADYEKMWKIYHDKALRDRLDNQGYNAFMTLMTQTDLYMMDESQIEIAMDYLLNSEKETTSGMIYDVTSNLEIQDNIKLAW